jgi:hypothetical protein
MSLVRPVLNLPTDAGDPTPLSPVIHPPVPLETGWNDSVQAPGRPVTRIMARRAPQDMLGHG